MAGGPTFPLIYMAPVDGVLLELPDEASIGERLPEIDTDAIGEQARRWVVDASGRRVRLRVEFGRVARFEILPGRPPMAETLDQMRLETIQARIARIPGGTGAIAWARTAGILAIITTVIATIVHGLEVASNPMLSFGCVALHLTALLFMAIGAGVVTYGAARRCSVILIGLCLLLLGGAALGPTRILALWEYGDLGATRGNPVAVVIVLGINLIIPGIIVLGATVSLLANGALYAQLARLEHGPRLTPS